MAELIATKQQASYETLDQIVKAAPAPLNSLLNQILMHTTASIFKVANHYVLSQWQSKVLPMCKRDIAVMSPFAQDDQNQMSFKTLDHYFGDSGKLKVFANKYASPFIEVNKNGQITQKTFYGVKLFDSKFFETLSVISGLNTLVYSSSKTPGAPSAVFALTPKLLSSNLTQITIQYGGQAIRYFNGPQFEQKLSWPNASSTKNQASNDNVVVTLQGADGIKKRLEFTGIWGLFKMFSHLIPQKNGDYILSLDGYQATFAINVIGEGTVSVLSGLNQFSCVQS